MFTGKVLMWNRVVSSEAELDYITLDYYDPQLAGGQVNQQDIAHLIIQLPVRETVLMVA